MVAVTNLSDLELAGRGIQAREIDSGQAADGDVLTADGAGGAAWAAPAGGGGGGVCSGVVWLGALGTDQSAVMNGHISAAYETATGAAPANGALLVSLICGMPCLRWRCIGRIRGSGGVSWIVLSTVDWRMTAGRTSVFAG